LFGRCVLCKRLPSQQQHWRVHHPAIQRENTPTRVAAIDCHPARPFQFGRGWPQDQMDYRHLGRVNTQLGAKAATPASPSMTVPPSPAANGP